MIGCRKARRRGKFKTNMADGDELEAVEVDQKLSESQKFSLYIDLEGYRSMWDTSYVHSKNKQQNKQQKEKGLEELSEKYNLSPGYLKRQLHTVRTALAREIKKESDWQKSRWKFFDSLSYMKEDVLRSLRAAKEENEWTENETEQLTEYYNQNDILWNHGLSSYRDRNLKNWATQSYPSFSLVKATTTLKVGGMCSRPFLTEVKKEEDSKVSGTGRDAVYTSQWKYLKSLMFIKGSDDVDPAISTLDPTENERLAKKIKAEKAKDIEEVAIRVSFIVLLWRIEAERC